MWKLLGVILIFQPNVVLGKLVGDHICLAEESYVANVTEYQVRNATVRSYQWCMNFPPRCSFYSTRKINETKSVEKNLTRIIETCCEGFKVENNRCISKCKECKNGLCQNEECICSSGFMGPSCDVVCDSGLWGKSCLLKCDCGGEECDPINGACILNTPTATSYISKPMKVTTVTSPINDEMKTEEFYIKTVTSTENLDTVSSVDVSEINEDSEITRVTDSMKQTYSSTPYLTTKVHVTSPSIPKIFDGTTPDPIKVVVSTSTFPITSHQTTAHKTTKLQYQKKLPTILESSIATSSSSYKLTTPAATEVPRSFVSVLGNQSTTLTYTPGIARKAYPSKHTQVSSSGNDYKEILIPVEIKYEPIKKHSYKKETHSTTPDNFDVEKSYSNVDNEDYLNGHNKYNRINHVSIAGTIILIITVLVISLIGIHNIRKSKGKKKKETENRICPTVALYTTSIFHTPLPDPPTFDNPSYMIPGEYKKSSNEQITFKTHIIRGKRNSDVTNEIQECREYVYDHPPSTGSYRAASTVDPLDNHLNQSLTTLEPVYDEIPNRNPEIAETSLNYTVQSQIPSTIYINTCGRTMF